MMKFYKTFSFFIFIILLFSFTYSPIYADDINESLEHLDVQKEVIETSAELKTIPDINSRAAVVIDRASNTVIYGKNENTIRKMASTTKIMTATIVIEQGNLNDIVEVSKKAAGTGGSRLGLKTGDKITVNDLLHGLMLCSGNDSAVALAEHIGGSIEGFSVLMNNKAKELGLKNTNFVTPHGLDKDEHYTTAYELALLSNYALKNPTFAKIVGTKTYTVNINGYNKTLSNTNELLGNLNGIYGIKTGFTNGANRCLVTACKRDTLDIICVVLGADTKNFRTKDSIKLIEYAFNNFEPVNIENMINNEFNNWISKNLDSFHIAKGTVQDISLKLEPPTNSIIPINKNVKNLISINIECNNYLFAPIQEGDIIGNITVSIDCNIISKVNILSNCNINKKYINNYLLEFFQDYKYLINDINNF